eukprot:CAMPEP_0181229144 /NCGR_PEP_ID=MMETSP1096-20121128/33731_1 /TAXON_ID=156174 ORGANISM="Chrysochromulina ericina, Strain CCMP281" /NCGR_SAMPLE_ID=MMETSP1096 /ASSEMBLY_ACC=CAM_ASM_000453 /LENGTH=85 /DNA_ID=CAMNT_0023322729 /DNA_START=216 /DNA_END=470 /DNA_ORIENTATION=-
MHGEQASPPAILLLGGGGRGGGDELLLGASLEPRRLSSQPCSRDGLWAWWAPPANSRPSCGQPRVGASPRAVLPAAQVCARGEGW